MPEINQYTDKVIAQGALNVRASGEDFGAGIGQGIQQMGQGLQSIEDAQRKIEVENDVTNVHTTMAAQRAKWQKELEDRTNQAQPGDQQFAPKLAQDMTDYFKDMSGQFKTRQGQQTFARMSADMVAQYQQQAITVQGNLAAADAKNKYASMVDSLTTVASQDHTQWASLVSQAKAAIDAPDGIYARISAPQREALKLAAEETIKFNAAKGFARRYPDAVLASQPSELRDYIKSVSTYDPQTGLPPDLKAPSVKALDFNGISAKAAELQAPGALDQTFQDVAKQNALHWRDLKLIATVKGADTPEAIKALADKVVQIRTANGGNVARTDIAILGGSSADARQQAANMAAIRQRVGIGSQIQPTDFAPSPAEKAGADNDWKKPKTGIDFIDSLPADKYFDILTNAEHYSSAKRAEDERVRLEAERLKKDQQDSVMSGYIARIIDPSAHGGRLSNREVLDNSTLTWQQKQHVIDYMAARARERASDAESKTNPGEVRRLMLMIHAADDDPRKTYNLDPVMESYKRGAISTNEMRMLRGEVEQLKDGSTQGFQKQVNMARELANRAFSSNVVLSGMDMARPGTVADVAYQFNQDLDAQIAQYRKENKDPRELLDPKSRSYVLSPERLKRFIPSDYKSATSSVLKSMPTYKDYDKLKSGDSYTDPDGNVRVKK